MKSKKTPPPAVLNRRASYDYLLGEDIVVGMALTGREVRAVRDGRVQLKGAFVTIRNNELWLNNASFSLVLNTKGENETTVDTSPRKLLATRSQIDKLTTEKNAGQTIVPIKMLTGRRFIKLVIAPGKGKRRHDKRQAIRKRDQERESQ